MFHLILFVGFLCFSLGESNSTAVATSPETQIPTTEVTTVFPLVSNTTMIAESTQQPGLPIIVGFRIGAKSLVDLTSNSAELQLLLNQIKNFIPPEHRATSVISVRHVQLVP